MRRLLMIVFATCLVAFAWAPAEAGVVFIPIVVPMISQVPTASTGGYDKIHTVALLSAVGTSMTLRNDHFMGPKTGTLDIAEWRIDDAVGATLRKYLGGRFAFKDVAFDRAALGKIPNGPWNNSNATVRKFLAGVPNDGLDAFILVRPDLEYEAPGLAGLALENESGPLIWANYEIDIIDAHTYETIAKAYSRVQAHEGAKPGFAGMYGGPNLALNDDLSPSDQQRTELHATVSALLQISLVETLRSLQLGVPLPPVGDHSIVPPPDTPSPFAAIKSVAVVSAVGDQLELEHLGFTIFARSEARIPVADWNIDAQVEGQARAILARQFTVKDVPLDRMQLAKARLIDKDDKFNPAFPGLAANPEIDAYIAFLKIPMQLGMTVVEGTGMGLWNHSLVDGTAVYASYAVAVIDAHTLKLIAVHSGSMSAKSSTENPYRKVDDAIWPDSPDKLTPENAAKVRDVLTELLADSIPETLYRMRLADDISTPAAPSQTPVQ